MIADVCGDLDKLVRRILPGHARRLLAEIATLSDAERCIELGLARSAGAEAWAEFEQYVIAASVRPSVGMVSLLGNVLVRRESLNNEDIVDVLGEIGDPAAVPFLMDAVLWMPDWDEFHGLAVKCVWALSGIDGERATEALRDIADTSVDRVREEAAAALRKRSS